VFSWAAPSAWSTLLSHHFPDVRFQFNTHAVWLPIKSPPGLFLLQGSLPWFGRILPTLPPDKPLLFNASHEASTHPPPAADIQYYSLSSTAAGSVIEARWWFGLRGLRSPPTPTAYRRTLQHIINAAERCSTFRSCTTADRDSSSSGRQPLPLHLALSWQYTPSVYASSGWVKRPLSTSELALVFDILTSTLPCYTTVQRHASPWLTYAPIKLLLHVGGVASARVKEVLVSMVSGESIDMEVTTKVEEAEESMETEPHAPAPKVNPAKAGESVASAAEKNTEPHAPQFSLGKTGVYWDVEDSPKKTGVNQAGIARVQEVEGRLERTDVNQEVEGYAGRTEVSRPCSGADTTGIPYAESEWQGADEAWWQQQAKSVKADDAANPTHLWDSRVWKLHHHEGLKRHHTQRFGLCPLESLWTWLIGRWRKNLLRSFMLYLLTCYGSERREATPNNLQLRRDLEAGRECLWRASEADWWDWRMGSRLFFWRWPADHHQAARGGYKPYFDGPSPRFLKPQPHEANKQTRKQVRAKLETVRARKYIAKGKVMSLTSYFSVPKGESDVRMVYDATRSNQNASLWAPNFGLPTVDSLLQGVNEGTWIGDLDIGEMFLNFCLHPKLQKLCGVDLRPYFAEEIPGKGTLWER
jgi:hypothetical protein